MLTFECKKFYSQCPAMFCLIISSKLSHQEFEFSWKVKVMGLNPGYLLKSFLLYLLTRIILKVTQTFEFKFSLIFKSHIKFRLLYEDAPRIDTAQFSNSVKRTIFSPNLFVLLIASIFLLLRAKKK